MKIQIYIPCAKGYIGSTLPIIVDISHYSGHLFTTYITQVIDLMSAISHLSEMLYVNVVASLLSSAIMLRFLSQLLLHKMVIDVLPGLMASALMFLIRYVAIWFMLIRIFSLLVQIGNNNISQFMRWRPLGLRILSWPFEKYLVTFFSS